MTVPRALQWFVLCLYGSITACGLAILLALVCSVVAVLGGTIPSFWVIVFVGLVAAIGVLFVTAGVGIPVCERRMKRDV